MKVVVTGAAGFIGSHVCDELIARGHDVLGIDDGSSAASDNIEHLLDNDQFEWWESEIDEESFLGTFDAIVHLAAVIGVDRVEECSKQILTADIDAARAVCTAESRFLLVASTSEVYGSTLTPSERLGEDGKSLTVVTTERARSSYAIAKLYLERMALDFGPKDHTLILRPFNIAGPRQNPDSGCVIARWARDTFTTGKLTVFGGTQLRTYGYVTEAAQAICSMVDRFGGKDGEKVPIKYPVINFAADPETNTISTAALANMFKERAREKFRIELEIQPPPVNEGIKRAGMNWRIPDVWKMKEITIPFTRSITEIVDSALDYFSIQTGWLDDGKFPPPLPGHTNV